MTWFAAAGWGALGSLSLLIGAWAALRWRPSSRVVGLILGFGAGMLLGAIAYELIPHESLGSGWGVVAFAAGAVVFFTADRAVTGQSSADGDASTSIVLGTLLDGIPESLVLGMTLAVGGKISIAFLGAVFLSNLPEAIGATVGMRDGGQSPQKIYRTWTGIVVVSAAFAGLGYGIVQLLPNADGGKAEAFAAGAVLTMLVNSMIPEAVREGRRWTGLICALGFAAAGALSLLE